MYFEDLNRAPNKEFGPKDIFEIASINIRRDTMEKFKKCLSTSSIVPKKEAIFCVSWVSKFFCLAKKTRYSSNSKAN